MKGNERQDILHLFISLPTDDVCSLRDVNTNMLARHLKSKVELRMGIPGDLIHLFFMNEELSDDKPLHDYKLRHGCILRVRLHKTWLGLFLACSKGDSFKVFNNGVQKMDSDAAQSFDPDVELWNKLVVKRATFALFMVTHRGFLSLMLQLLNSSAADVNGVTIFGRTCLHIAAFQGFVGCVSLLLSEGALSSALDVFGKTPLQLAYINRHVYCQKRLYLHQMAGLEESKSLGRKKADGSEPRLPSAGPNVKLLSNSERTSISNKENYKTGNVAQTTPTSELRSQQKAGVEKTNSEKGFPHLIPRFPQRRSTSPPDPIVSQSITLPVMKISAPTETNHSEEDDRLSHSYPNLGASVSSSSQSKRDPERDIPNSIRGIERILKASQEELVGEYHNISESIADINMATLKLSLPREDTDGEVPADVKKDEPENCSDDHRDALTRIQNPLQNKKFLGFVLKPGEQDQDESSTQQSEGETDPDREEVWEPSQSKIIPPRVTSSLSYDEWLAKKREMAKNAGRPSSASIARTKVGREMDAEAFQKWLNEKKRSRRRRASSPKALSGIGKNQASSGVSFEIWLNQKRQDLAASCDSQYEVSENTDSRPRTTHLGGKTFAEWLSEKRKGFHHCDSSPENVDAIRTRLHSGKSFRDWLRDKRKEKQQDLAGLESLEMKKLQQREFLEEQRRLNPRVKTFEQWLEEKRAQSFIEAVGSRNAPDEPVLLNSKTRFREDAELVFDIWLTSKHLEELSKEEEKYEEMIEKWRKKEQERLQIRNGLLRRLNQLKKEK